MMALWNRTRLTQRLGIEYPIVQGPLGACMYPTMPACIRKGMRPAKRRDRQGARLVSMKQEQTTQRNS
jgi:hypothetical protein